MKPYDVQGLHTGSVVVLLVSVGAGARDVLGLGTTVIDAVACTPVRKKSFSSCHKRNVSQYISFCIQDTREGYTIVCNTCTALRSRCTALCNRRVGLKEKILWCNGWCTCTVVAWPSVDSVVMLECMDGVVLLVGAALAVVMLERMDGVVLLVGAARAVVMLERMDGVVLLVCAALAVVMLERMDGVVLLVGAALAVVMLKRMDGVVLLVGAALAVVMLERVGVSVGAALAAVVVLPGVSVWLEVPSLLVSTPLVRTNSSVLTTFPIYYAILMRNHCIIIGLWLEVPSLLEFQYHSFHLTHVLPTCAQKNTHEGAYHLHYCK